MFLFNRDGTLAEAPFLAKNHVQSSRSVQGMRAYDTAPYSRVFSFAKRALARLISAAKGQVLFAPVIRVDIMEQQCGKFFKYISIYIYNSHIYHSLTSVYLCMKYLGNLVVNEFESLEALVEAYGHGRHPKDQKTQHHFHVFWRRELQYVVDQLKLNL